MIPNFHIDTANNDARHFYVDVMGSISVAIKITDEGVVVDLFSAHVADEALASTWALFSEAEG